MSLKTTYFNTPVHEATKMLQFSDEDILDNSYGEIKRISLEEDETSEGADIDPEIFGKMDYENVTSGKHMGHIVLSTPVVNINYLFGTKPVLPGMLVMSHKDVEKVVYFASYLVTSSENDKYPVGKILSEAEYRTMKESGIDNVDVQMGAEAIETIMKMRGIDTDGIILHNIPILPLAFRFHPVPDPLTQDMVFKPWAVDRLTRRLIERNRYAAKHLAMGLPEIIERNEKRMVQEYTDAYINNGARGYAVLNDYGEPFEGLQSIARLLDGKHRKPWSYDPFDKVDVEKIKEIAEEIGKRHIDDDSIMLEAEDHELCGKAGVYVKDIITGIAKERYAEYEEFLDVLVTEGVRAFKRALFTYARDVYIFKDAVTEPIEKSLFSGIVPAMDLKSRNLAFVDIAGESEG